MATKHGKDASGKGRAEKTGHGQSKNSSGKHATDKHGDKHGAEVEKVVRRYCTLLNQLEPDLPALEALLSSKLRQIEHPNALSPHGVRRGKDQLLAEQRGTEELLAEQSFEILDVMVSGSRAAVRGVWAGSLRDAAGPLPAGTRLVAHVAAFLQVRDGRIVEHDSYECYEPIGS